MKILKTEPPDWGEPPMFFEEDLTNPEMAGRTFKVHQQHECNIFTYHVLFYQDRIQVVADDIVTYIVSLPKARTLKELKLEQAKACTSMLYREHPLPNKEYRACMARLDRKRLREIIKAYRLTNSMFDDRTLMYYDR